MRIAFATLALALLCIGPVRGQDASFPDAAARRQAAAALVDAMHLDEAMPSTSDQMMQYLTAVIGPNAASDAIASAVRDVVNHEMSWEAIRPDFIELYASQFTADELRRLTAFYRSPLGQKLVKATPALNEGAMRIAQERAVQFMPALIEKIGAGQ